MPFVIEISIHHFQGLSLGYLAFDPINVLKHGLTYITLYPTSEHQKNKFNY